MAQPSKSFFCKLVLVLSLLVLISMADSRKTIGSGNQDVTLFCNSVHGTESGETCSTVAEEFSLSLEDFLNINPNINCDAIFVGQWLCVDASASN